MSYEQILPLVSKPSRYISVEKNAVLKDYSKVEASILLCFPEVYEIGMSHLGLKILYHILNRMEFVAAERCFAPWVDMEAELRRFNQSLLSMESQKPLRSFDFVGFSLQSELTFTNLINMLDLSFIPVWSKDRGEEDPIVLAGGPVTSNPEPCADFIDAFLIGDGEEALPELMEFYRVAKKRGMSRERILVGIANIPGFYVPRFYREVYSEDGVYAGVERISEEVPSKIVRRFVAELDPGFYPDNPVVPHTAPVQDRLVVEVVRGCTQGCRFCQAGYIYRPIRELPIQEIKKITEDGIRKTGYDEVGLVSLSTADYSDVSQMVSEVSEVTSPRNAAISLPSLRADRFSVELADSVRQIKQTGFTFAPEAGSVRLRQVINKNISNEELLASARMAFDKGWSTVKFYFMVGLPTETWEDLDETIELIRQIEKIAKGYPKKMTVNVSFGPFVPKAHTPFQWDAFMDCEEITKRQQYIRRAVASKIVQFKWQAPELSHFEAVVSKGNRSVAQGLYKAFEAGSRFEGWQETFNYNKVMQAFTEASVDIGYWSSEKSVDAALPWDHIDSSIKKKYLQFERKKAFRTENKTTTDCRFGDCHYCGIPTPKVDIRLKHEKPSEEELTLRRETNKSVSRPSESFAHSRSEGFRYRLFYSKTGKAKFLAHTDLIRLIQMGLAACSFPMTWSRGFTPRPVMQFGPVLPLGVESLAEVADLWVYAEISQEMINALNQYLPTGVQIQEFFKVDLNQKSLSLLFPYAVYSLDVPSHMGQCVDALRDFDSRESFVVDHRDKEIDLKKAIRTLEIVDRRLMMELNVSSQDGQNANPIMVVDKVLGIPKEQLGMVTLRKEFVVETA